MEFRLPEGDSFGSFFVLRACAASIMARGCEPGAGHSMLCPYKCVDGLIERGRLVLIENLGRCPYASWSP
jgi:hypothetical protein